MKVMNKYELVVIASREARRLNDIARMHGRELKRRPTKLAWERLGQGKVKYTYEPETLDQAVEQEGTGIEA